jgi:2-methylcitrate dehydratase PrpD
MTQPAAATIASQLADFVCAVRTDPARIPADVQHAAMQRILDNLGCIAFGRTVPAARTIADLAAGMGRGDCRLVGSAERTSATAAALAHGTLAQAFELNDLGVYVHPGACIVPACLAGMDLRQGPVSGADLVAAVVVGYEVTVRLSECVGPGAELEIGWHTPGFHGAVGAAAATAMLLGLERTAIAQAMVIAADLAGGGLMLARLGSDIKRVHCGRGAETGVLAALLASQGMRSRLDTFEHPVWGYCRTMVGHPTGFDLDVIRSRLGEDFVGFRRTAMKYYPVGAEVIGMIDAVRELKARHGVTAADVEQVEVGTPTFFVDAQGHEFPTSDAQIHFNSEYGIAMALVHDVQPVYQDRAILDYWRTGYHDAQVKELAGRIQHVVHPELEKKNPYGIDSCVKLMLRDGSLLEHRTDYLSSADSAGTMKFGSMDDDRVVRKFRALTGQVLGPAQQDRLANTVAALVAEGDARVLWEHVSF